MSGPHAMSENIGVSESYELVSDVKDETVSAKQHEIMFGGPQEEQEQHAWNTNSALEIKEFTRDTFQAETLSFDDEIDIKYELNDIDHNSTSDAEDDHLADAILKPLNHGSIKFEEKELNQLYLDLLQCERNCEICQNYIRKLSEHVRGIHAADQPTLDPPLIDPVITDQSSANEIKCEIDEDIERMDGPEESDSSSESEIESDSGSDPDYNASPVLTRKCKSGQKLGKRDHSSLKEEMVCHSKILSREKPVKCEECGMSFTKMFLLTRHSRSHVVRRCSKGFTRKDNLTRHMMIHPGVRLLKCEECGKDFTRRKDLSDHMRVHTRGKPYKCGECVKSYITKNHLTFHMMSHTGERPYKCGQCSSRFKTKQLLTVHTMIHTGERPFNCEECGKGFTTSYKLGRHMATHKQKT